MTQDWIQLGLRSYQELSRAFLATVFGGEALTNELSVCGLKDGSPLETTFFLDPTADHECVGTDWIGKYILYSLSTLDFMSWPWTSLTFCCCYHYYTLFAWF
jgi:hypothetical protein